MPPESTQTGSIAPGLDGRMSACRQLLLDMRRVVVAFSAGVDSTCLLALALRTLGPANVLAAVGVSPSLPRRELDSARHIAASLGVELAEVTTCELDNPQYAANPAERCFFCKHDLFSRLTQLAQQRGFDVVVSGANADDAGDFRPGLKAGAELGVRNPLMEAGLSKGDIRELSRQLELPTWDKPAMACLASRVPYGETITAERLGRIERAEQILRDIGLRQLRVRDHGAVARLEVLGDDMTVLVARRQQVVQSLLQCGYTYVAMDLAGFRSGSGNEVLPR